MAVHLHCHSEYSLSHGMLRLSGERELGRLAAERGIEAVALTDSNNLHGAISHHASCLRHGIKPILGCHAAMRRHDQEFSATLLCTGREGFVSLSRLLTDAQRRSGGRIDAEALEAGQAAGLIMLTGYDGDVAAALRAGKPELARSLLSRWAGLFPDERLACSLSLAGRPEEEEICAHLAGLAAALGLPAAATHPCLFADEDDFEHHEVRSCIANGWQLNSSGRPRLHTPRQRLLGAGEMEELFGEWPGALDNSAEIARRCNYDFGLTDRPQFPKFLDADRRVVEDPPRLLREQASAGLERIVADGRERTPYEERLESELEVICDKGFADYFLIVADFVSFAKRSGIPVGPGRGSGAGSLVAYALGITGVDPLEYDLLFERFLNPERTALPDFDIDFCKDRRGEIFAHAREAYGEDCVAQVATFGTLKAKAAMRDVCRALGLPFIVGDRAARLIPEELNITLAEAWEKSKDLQRYIRDENLADAWRHCLALESLPRQASTHAAAILIASKPITEYCPLAIVGHREGDEPVCQYAKDDAEAVGLIKFDFLGLKNLTMLHMAEGLIRKKKKDFSFASLGLDDRRSFGLYRTGNTMGVFQCESAGMVALMRRLQPESIDDIAVTISLYRPGVLSNDMHNTYLKARKNPHEAHYVHPEVKPDLAPTFGVMIYQEQVMRISQHLAGFTLGKADELRAAIGKKNVKAMAALGEEFIEGCSRKLERKVAAKLFDEIKEFAGYGFNKSHAISYALISYRTAYCKAHFPGAFYASALSVWSDDTRTMSQLLEDARINGVEIELPCVNRSQAHFDVLGEKGCRFGLGSVRGIGSRFANELIAERDRGGVFASLEQLCERLPRQLLSASTLESLVNSGACDCLIEGKGAEVVRPTLLAQAAGALEHAAFIQQHANQESLFGGEGGGGNGERPEAAALEPAMDRSALLAAEEGALGMSVSDSFFGLYRWLLTGRIAPLSEIGRHSEPRWWAGHVSRNIVSARIRDQRRTVFRLTDGTASIEVNAGRDAELHGIDFGATGLVVVAWGQAEEAFGGGGQVLQATEIFSIDQWCARNIARIVVEPPEGKVRPALDELERLCAERESGVCSLRLRLRSEGASGEIDLGRRLRLRADDLVSLRSRLGEKALRLVQ